MNWTLLTPGQGRIVAAVADGGRGFGYGSTPTRICRRAAQKVRNQDCRGRLVQRDGFLAGPNSGVFALLHVLHDLVAYRIEYADVNPAVPLGRHISADVDEKQSLRGPSVFHERNTPATSSDESPNLLTSTNHTSASADIMPCSILL